MTQMLSLLPGTLNTRDLGGHAVPGGATRARLLLRSDHLARTGAADAALLKQWGVCAVIDLRRDDEVERMPTAPALARAVPVVRIPIDNLPFFAGRRNDPGFRLWELYAYMLRRQAPRFAAAVREIARWLPGGVLFHCSAGKDRTGLLAALLLRCAGVDAGAVVQDYAVTGSMLAAKPAREIATIPPDTDPAFYRMLLSSEACHMEKALALLEQGGGARAYLLNAGVPARELDRVTAHLAPRPGG